jgi:tRNA pseudouridine55 synthase
VDKPQGPTSFNVIRSLRKTFGQREIGHLGTLDPMATGLLAVLLGKATKLADYLVGDRKSYRAVFLLGLKTSTFDATGAVEDGAEWEGALGLFQSEGLAASLPPALLASFPDEEKARAALDSFMGEREQRPPNFSAIKVGGVRSYDRARRGEDFLLPKRRATLFESELEIYRPPFLALRVTVSSGYYIRSLAQELGEALGLAGGVALSLRRLSVGDFKVEDALSPTATKEEFLARLIAPRALLPRIPEITLPAEDLARITKGLAVAADALVLPGPGQFPRPERIALGEPGRALPQGVVKIVDDAGVLVALAEVGYRQSGGPDARLTSPGGKDALSPARPFLRPKRVFAENALG